MYYYFSLFTYERKGTEKVSTFKLHSLSDGILIQTTW